MTVEPKMSLVAAFDDLCRATDPLTEGYADEFIKFVKNQEKCRQQWHAAELELQQMQAQYQKVIAEKRALEANLVHARNAIELEMKKRIGAEQDRDSLERQLTLIRELLLTDKDAFNDQTREKLAFLNSTAQLTAMHETAKRLDTINESTGSLLSSDDISYDRTDDNIDVGFAKNRRAAVDKRSGGGGRSSHEIAERLSDGGKRRPSAPKEPSPPKRSRTEVSTGSVVATTTIEIPKEGKLTASAVIEARAGRTRYSSECSEHALNQARVASQTDDESTLTITGKVGTPQTNWTPLRQYSSANKLSCRGHDFCNKTIIKPEGCLPCGKKIKFGKMALKCKDCKAVCHPDCKDKVPLPCVPTVHTPTTKGTVYSIADYTPLTVPMVPALVIHCVNEVEARGLTEVGIYRVPGSEKEVKDLKEKFLRGKGVPNLSKVDVHVICGCFKDFLRSLKESLITNTQWKDFVSAAEMKDRNDGITALYQAISELPRPNRDTLAFVILHLQRVAESPECKMPISNLAKIFGPTIVGYSSLDPDPATMLAEIKKQVAVMEALLNISSDYWSSYVNAEYDLDPSSFISPDTKDKRRGSTDTRASYSSRRGFTTHTTFQSRDTNSRTTRCTRASPNYFTSPMLK